MLSKLLERMNIQFLLQLDKYLVTQLRTSLKMMMSYGYRLFSLLLKYMPLACCLQTIITFFVMLTMTLQVKNLTSVKIQSASLETERLKLLLETTISLVTMWFGSNLSPAFITNPLLQSYTLGFNRKMSLTA